jgi:hypothetical protein
VLLSSKRGLSHFCSHSHQYSAQASVALCDKLSQHKTNHKADDKEKTLITERKVRLQRNEERKMATSVRLDDAFVEDVKIHSAASHRTVPKQIEHWAKIGQIVEDNPDLPYEFIREALIAREAVSAGKVTKYVRRTKRATR